MPEPNGSAAAGFASAHAEPAAGVGALVDVRAPAAPTVRVPEAEIGSMRSSESVGPHEIDVTALVRAVERPAAGAIVTFEGRVRDHDEGRGVTALTYEAHPDAAAVLDAVAAEARHRPGVEAAIAAHRTGDLAIGDLAFFVAVSAAHRREAFEACAWLVDEAKARTPIWKHQAFADGTSEWVNCP